MTSTREAPVRTIDDPPARGNLAHGLPSPQDEPPQSGFTAVNGDARRMAAHTPTEPADSSTIHVGKQPAGSGATSNPPDRQDSGSIENEPQHEKRPDHWQHEPSTGIKRKRSNSRERPSARDMQLDTRNTSMNGVSSPKRRHLQPITDSAIDLTSPNNETLNVPSRKEANSESASLAPQEREPSPAQRNQKEQLPKPSLEAEAHLQESLRKFQQNQQASETRQAQSGSVDQAESPEDDQDDDDEQNQGDGPTSGHDFDPKKRKRNFSNRTKTGCHTCRGRKKKCDEAKPTCNNCDKGGFVCQGYGPRQPGQKPGHPQQARNIPLQSKGAYDPAPGGAVYWQQPPPPHPTHPPRGHDDSRLYGHWGYNGPPVDLDPTRRHWDAPSARPASQDRRDGWARPVWPYSEPPQPTQQPPPSFTLDRLPPSGFHSAPPPPGPAYPLERPPPPVQPPILDRWDLGLPARQPSGPPTVISSKGSVGSGGSHHTSHMTLQSSENKEKMLTGKPYKHCIGTVLNDRQHCHAALVKYNRAAEDPVGWSNGDLSRLFQFVLNPTLGPAREYSHFGPIGSVGETTVVEPPFKCDYGYHLHIGKNVLVQPGCYFQDAGGIYIGNRVVIGPNVQLMTTTVAKSSSQDQGPHGWFKAGMIKIEDDVFIGAGAMILPYVTIRKGAVVGAGSVVTRDVKEKYVVAGCPAKRVHKSDDLQDQEKKMIKHMESMASKGWKEERQPKPFLEMSLSDPPPPFP